MIHLLRAEWRKVTTVKLGWGMLLGAMALAALGVVAQIASNGVRGNGALPLTAPMVKVYWPLDERLTFRRDGAADMVKSAAAGLTVSATVVE